MTDPICLKLQLLLFSFCSAAPHGRAPPLLEVLVRVALQFESGSQSRISSDVIWLWARRQLRTQKWPGQLAGRERWDRRGRLFGSDFQNKSEGDCELVNPSGWCRSSRRMNLFFFLNSKMWAAGASKALYLEALTMPAFSVCVCVSHTHLLNQLHLWSFVTSHLNTCQSSQTSFAVVPL